jgi:hypothetical protein
VSPNYQLRHQVDKYNAEGDLLEQHMADDVHVSYVWAYNSMYPVAEVKNAAESEIAYTSFELFDEKGNWTFYNNAFTQTEDVPNIIYGTSIMGKRVYNLQYALNGGIQKSGLNSSAKYHLATWFLENEPVVTVGHLVSKTITNGTNGWKLLDIVFDNSTSVILPQLSVDSYIDELRLYPEMAQMATFAYNPLVGMTGKCD